MKKLILIATIICMLFTVTIADVGDWNSYDSYDSYDYSSDDNDYSWDDDDDDYSYRRNNNDDDYKSAPKITDESYEYDESWEQPTVIPVDGYPEINYRNTTPNYYFYHLSTFKAPKSGGYFEPKGTIKKTVRIKKTALSYDYDVIYDREDESHTINNPLNKEVKTEDFYLTPDYEKVLHEELCPGNTSTDQANSYKLNDYFYYKKLDETGKEIVYKVYKDLVKIDAKNVVKYKGIFIYEKDYTPFVTAEDIGKIEGVDGVDYYINNSTNQIVATSWWTINIEKGIEWTLPFIIVFSLLFNPIGLIIIVTIIAALIEKSKKRTSIQRRECTTIENNQELESIDKLEQSDINFNLDEFLQWVESVFMELQIAWTNKDVEKIKILEDNALYSTHKAQLERYIKDKKTNYIERIAIVEREINGYKEEDGFEFIDLTLWVEMIDYIKDDVTGEVIKGRTDDRLMMEYDIVFKRKKGVMTDTVGEIETVNCPSCGAPVDISASAVCEYCNNVINTSNHSWVISKYKGRNVYR